MTDAEKKPCCATEPAEKDTAPSCCRHKDRTPEEYRALANRLSRIEGQVRGIRGMVEKDATAWTSLCRWLRPPRR